MKIKTNDKASNWSLEKELCKIANKSDINSALYTLGFMPNMKSNFRFDETDSKWFRGGAETYIYHFRVIVNINNPIEAVIKACVAFAPDGNLNSVIEKWIERRKVLEQNGIAVPKLYAWGHGVIIEEFLPYEVNSLLKASSTAKNNLLKQLALYAASISSLGFAPINPFHDLRSHGEDVVAIDFGTDLGPARVSSAPQPKIFKMLCDYLQTSGISLSTEMIRELKIIFYKNFDKYNKFNKQVLN